MTVFRIAGGPWTHGVGDVRYGGFWGNASNAATTSGDVACELNDAYTASDLEIYLTSNTLDADGVIEVLDGGTGTGVLVDIFSSLTGRYEDTTNNYSFASGDIFNYSIDQTGVTSGSSTGHSAISLDGTYGVVFSYWGSSSSSGVTRVTPISGGNTAASATDSVAQMTARKDFNASFFGIYVSAYSLVSGSGTANFRINGSSSGYSISITGTGRFTDTSGTGAVVAGDEVNFQVTSAASSGSLLLRTYTLKHDGDYTIAAALYNATTVDTYFSPGTLYSSSSRLPTEKTARIAGDAKYLFVNVGTNSTTATSTFHFVKGGTSVISGNITTGTTGFFEETTTAATLVDGDTVALRGTRGSAHSLVFYVFSISWPITAAVASADPPIDDVEYLHFVPAPSAFSIDLYAALDGSPPIQVAVAGTRNLDPLVDLTSITPHVDDEEGAAFLVQQWELQRWPAFPRELEPATRQGYIDVMSWVRVISSVLLDLTSQPPEPEDDGSVPVAAQFRPGTVFSPDLLPATQQGYVNVMSFGRVIASVLLDLTSITPQPEDDGSGMIARSFRPGAEFPADLLPATQQGFIDLLSGLRTVASVLLDLTSITPEVEDTGGVARALELKWQETPPFPPELIAALDQLINLPAVAGQRNVDPLIDLTSQPPDVEDQGLAFLHKPVVPEQLPQELRQATEQGWAPLASQLSISGSIYTDLTSIPAGDDPEAIARATELELTRWVRFPVSSIPQLDTFIPPQPVSGTRTISGVQIDLTSLLPETGEHDVWDVVQREARLADGRRMLQLDVMKAVEHQFNPPSGAATPINPTLTISAVQIDLQHWAVSAEGEGFTTDLGVVTWETDPDAVSWGAEEDDGVAGITFIQDRDANP